MPAILQTPYTASITEFKSNPMAIAACGGGEAVAILNRNTPAFYCAPVELYHAMIVRLEQKD